MLDKQQLRRDIRARRRAMDQAQQQAASQSLLQNLINSPPFQSSQHIAFYLANEGEIDPHPLLDAAWQQGKRCYLPILDGNGENRLFFAPYTPDTELIPNRYDIPEPRHTPDQLHPGNELDLILVPLVAVDLEGNRMGMGKGFYDRTFEFRRTDKQCRKPILIGLAHSFQQIAKMQANEWDVPLEGLATEKSFTLFDKNP